MTSITTPGPIFRMSPEMRLVIARQFMGEDVVVTHSPRRLTESDRHFRGQLVSVAIMDHGTTQELLTLRMEGEFFDMAFPLSQVRNIELV